MNLIFFYVSDQPCNRSISLSELEQPATNKFAINIQSDGIFALLDLISATEVVDHTYCIIDSKKGNGVLRPTRTTTICCVSNIELLNDPVFKLTFFDYKKDCILFFRGGFRAWLPFLNNLDGLPLWKLYYRANTNHGHWPYWDVVLNDLCPNNLYLTKLRKNCNKYDIVSIINMSGGSSSTTSSSKNTDVYSNKYKLIYHYRKPVNEYIFKPIIPAQHKYDIMIGASHIHTKKGQHIALQACNKLASGNKKYTDLKYIMPGAMIRSGTNDIINKSWPIWLYKPGFQKRSCLAHLMNNSKLLIHAGPGGQNDRSVLEALACGIPVMIKDPARYSPWMEENDYVTICNSNSIDDWAQAIERAWDKIPQDWNAFNQYRKNLVDWYYYVNGLWEVALTRMNHLITALKWAEPGDFENVLQRLEQLNK